MSKRVPGGKWTTLETTFNVRVRATFVGPAKASVRVRFLFFSFQEQVLDGTTPRVLRFRFGAVQIRPLSDCVVDYGWGPDDLP
jgi:hypothetical protein